MSEINCLVLLNNPEKEIVLNMDNQVTYAMFNDEVRKNLQIDPSDPIQYSYFDSDGDRVLFNTEEEFKEFLTHASTIGFMITIFAYAQPKLDSLPSDEQQHEEEKEKEAPLESSNIIHREEQQEEVPVQDKPAEEQESEIHPSNVEDKVEQKEFNPQFNIKYQLPVGRQYHRKVQPGQDYKVFCDHCDQEIANLRFKCLQCPDYDLCEKCEDLKCKSAGSNQIHPEDHIFAKIRNPIHRPVPFICVPGNSPTVCPRQGLRRFPVAPEHLRRNKKEIPKDNKDIKVNNNNNNNLTKEERAKAKKERRLERREGMKSMYEQRGEKIQELESRIQALEQQFAAFKLPQTSSNLPAVPQMNNPNNNNNNVYSETFDSQRKFWPFQC